MDDEPRSFRFAGKIREVKRRPKKKPHDKGPDWPRIIGVLLFLWLLWSLLQHGHR
jgi:hypothetical protein